MIPHETSGAPLHLRMFELLKEASKKLNYDAWHQFAVVNPLRYLGLIEESKGSKGPFKIDVGLVKKYLGRLEERYSNAGWMTRHGNQSPGTPKEIKKSLVWLDTTLKANSTIADAANPESSGKLRILTKQQDGGK